MPRMHRAHAGERAREPGGPRPAGEVVAWGVVAVVVLVIALAVGR